MLTGQVLDELANRPDLVWVQPQGRFVENDQLRLMHQSVGQTDPLLIALGQVPNNAFLYVGQAALVQHGIDSLAGLRAAQPLQAGAELQVFAHPHIPMQRVVFRHVTDAAPHFVGLVKHVVAGHTHRA